MTWKMASKILFTLMIVCSTLLAISCGQSKIDPNDDGPTYGSIKISVDDAFQSVMDSEITAFQASYDQAKIHASYKTEVDAMSDLLNDSARIIVISRELTPAEKKTFEDIKIVPRVTKIAVDAVALIVNMDNSDSLIKIQNIIDLLSGKIANWNQLVPKSKNNAPVKVVFDNNKSGIVNYCVNLLPGKKILNKNVYAVNSSSSVVDYVKKEKNALGFINLAWISDGRDSASKEFLSSIRVAAVAPYDSSEFGGNYFQPYQAYLALKQYPMMRGVYVISREARAGLGLGFASYLAGDKGQRILYKSGLLPAQMPIRLVETQNKNINITRD
ncbi:MAG: substrate-binding domain-containing protein [Ignavibacteria bacterium]|nr:substrate-binding domain-containing protein [Ignavibacteria bacterium]